MKPKLGITVLVTLILAAQTLIEATPAHAQSAQRLRFARGADTIIRTGVLRFGGMDRYVIRLGANDNFDVSVDSGPNNNVILILWGRDGTVLISDHADATHWSGVTPKTQDYYIDVRAMNGTTANYSLRVQANPINPNPPNPPDPRIKRIVFAPGTISASVGGTVSAAHGNDYVIKINGGQRMLITTQAEEQRISLSVVGADGTVLQSSMGGSSTFSGNVPSTQDYFLRVRIEGSGFAVYRMTVTVEPLVY